ELTEHFDIVPAHNDHITGGVIMGDDPDTSVLNNYLQMWDMDNIFVIGASAFPHNGGYNPTGTVGALAYRAAEWILRCRYAGVLLLVAPVNLSFSCLGFSVILWCLFLFWLVFFSGLCDYDSNS